jgi:hypothetical protein
MASWICHTCERIDTGFFLWLARRHSIRHELKQHGFSHYKEKEGSR